MARLVGRQEGVIWPASPRPREVPPRGRTGNCEAAHGAPADSGHRAGGESVVEVRVR